MQSKRKTEFSSQILTVNKRAIAANTQQVDEHFLFYSSNNLQILTMHDFTPFW